MDRWGKQEDEEEQDPDKPVEPVEKPNFGLSGALAKDRTTGNVQNGVVMKWSEPPEARAPQKRYRLYVFKGDELICTCCNLYRIIMSFCILTGTRIWCAL